MAAPRKPQDHKPKTSSKPDPSVGFTFERDGETYQLAAAADVLTVGFARKNRRRSDADQFFTMLEMLADDDALDAIDGMQRDEFAQFQKDFYAHNGADLGESEASSIS